MPSFELIAAAIVVLIGFTSTLALIRLTIDGLRNDHKEGPDDLGPFFDMEQTGGWRR